MITNIIAVITVCIVTNVTTTDNAQMGYRLSEQNGGISYGCLVFGCTEDHDWVKATPATEKTETTEVVEVKTIKFTWEGQEYIGKCERVLSLRVRKWRLSEDWVEQAESEG